MLGPTRDALGRDAGLGCNADVRLQCVRLQCRRLAATPTPGCNADARLQCRRPAANADAWLQCRRPAATPTPGRNALICSADARRGATLGGCGARCSASAPRAAVVALVAAKLRWGGGAHRMQPAIQPRPEHLAVSQRMPKSRHSDSAPDHMCVNSQSDVSAALCAAKVHPERALAALRAALSAVASLPVLSRVCRAPSRTCRPSLRTLRRAARTTARAGAPQR